MGGRLAFNSLISTKKKWQNSVRHPQFSISHVLGKLLARQLSSEHEVFYSYNESAISYCCCILPILTVFRSCIIPYGIDAKWGSNPDSLYQWETVRIANKSCRVDSAAIFKRYASSNTSELNFNGSSCSPYLFTTVNPSSATT